MINKIIEKDYVTLELGSIGYVTILAYYCPSKGNQECIDIGIDFHGYNRMIHFNAPPHGGICFDELYYTIEDWEEIKKDTPYLIRLVREGIEALKINYIEEHKEF